MLDQLPPELIHSIAILHIAHHPLGPPSPLLDLVLVNRSLHDVLSSNELKARIFKLKFDTGAVRRRAFIPDHAGYADQLVQYCEVLRGMKRGDDVDANDVMLGAWVMMMENDGKNYAQLEWAGVHDYLNGFLRNRLLDGSERNHGWLLDSAVNSCALWVAWMTTDRRRIFKEISTDRDDFLTRILPFILLPHRYPSTEAPPNHPFFPLTHADQPPLTSQTHSGPPYPSYHHHHTANAVSLPYFGSSPRITPPLPATAARLLFASRRELSRISIPAHFPEGPPREYYEELNKGQSAQVVRGASWDWDQGRPFAVNTLAMRKAYRPGPQGTTEETEAFMAVYLAGDSDQALDAARKGLGINLDRVVRTREWIEDGDEESRKWDSDWWRRRLCANIYQPRPTFAPGLMLKPGFFRGLWQGRLYMPQAEAMQAILHYPAYPGPSLFTERTVNLVVTPMLLNIEEHHRICHCPIHDEQPIDNDDDSPPTGTRLDPSPQNSGCGVIPVPKPSIYPPEHLRWLVQPTFMYSRADAVPAQNQNNHPQPIFGLHHPQGDPDSFASSTAYPASAAETSSLPGGVVSPSGSSTGGGGGGGSVDPIIRPVPIDYSVINAWFPGRSVPSVCIFKRKVERLLWDDSSEGIQPDRGRWMKKRMRDEIVFRVRGIAGGEGSSLMGDWRKADGECRTSDVGQGQAPPKGVYVYETYDPSRPSSHDPQKCARCKQWEAVAERERRKAGTEAQGAAEEGGDDEDEDVAMCGSEEEDVEMEDEEEEEEMTMTERDKEGILQLEDAMSTYGFWRGPPLRDGEGDAEPNVGMALEPIDAESMGLFDFRPSSSPTQQQILGDDEPKGQPSLYDPNTNTHIQGTRRVFDPKLVGAPERCAGGIRDVVLTGETGRKLVWEGQRYKLFGRVRKWDGLVGFVRVDQGVWEQQQAAGGSGLGLNVNPPLDVDGAAEAAAEAAITNMIILGYVVGDQNFVGEWRMAASDPLRPGWCGPVVMCRREPPPPQQQQGGVVGFEPVGGEAVWI